MKPYMPGLSGRLSRIVRWVAPLMLLLLAVGAHAQWQVVAPYAVQGQNSGGAICYYNHTIWAGAINLVSSTDGGSTWQTANYSGGKINSIRFFDQWHGVIASSIGVYLTSDGGSTWTAAQNFPSTQTTLDAGYGRSASTIYVDLENTGLVISRDGGNSWQISPVNSVVLAMAINTMGTIYLTGGEFLPPGLRAGQLYSSTDSGQSWRTGAGYFDEDSYSITIDSSNPDLLYLANEDNLWTGDDSSNIFVTTDAGQTWTPNFAQLITYLNGAITNSTHAVYTGTLRDGVLRSTDQGITWTNIGGPGALVDCRSLCAIDDNTVFALDGLGNIWETVNSGGDSLSIPNIPPSITASPSILFISDTVTCDSLTRAIVFKRTGGPALYVKAWSIVGPDSASYRVTGISNDSMLVTLLKAGHGAQYAQLVLTLNNGSREVVTLKGFENTEANALTVSTRTLFSTDTVQCDSLTRPLHFIRSGCAPPLILGWKIIGKDSLSYATSNLTNDSMTVTLRGIHPGQQDARLIFGINNGTHDTVQLGGFVSAMPNQLRAIPSQVFTNDTVQCDSLTRFIVFARTGCFPPSVAGWSIIGDDSVSYSAHNLSKDSLEVTLHGVSPGPQAAQLILRLNDGSSDTVALAGYVSSEPNALVATPNPLFKSDTVACDSITRSLVFGRSGCYPPHILDCRIIGSDSASYRAGGLTSDSIQVTFIGKRFGRQDAELVLVLDNGSSDTVLLAGISDEGPNKLQTVPATLFTADTVSCDGTTRSVAFARLGCNPPSITSWSVVGRDSANYRCKNFSDDSMQITLYGNTEGSQVANLVVYLDNGTSDTVSLGGYVRIAPSPLSIPAADQIVTTLGETRYVPISIGGLLHAEDVNLVLHYDGSLDYMGSFSPSGASLDIAGSNWPGRAMLHIAGAMPGVAVGYAEFNVFSDSNDNAHVTFDSLDILTAASPCEYSSAPLVTDTIFPPKGCTIPILSQLVHLGREPVFSVRPNPATDDVTITSSEGLGYINLTIYDMLGTVRNEIEAAVRKSEPVELALPDADGVYTVALKSASGTYMLRVIKHR